MAVLEQDKSQGLEFFSIYKKKEATHRSPILHEKGSRVAITGMNVLRFSVGALYGDSFIGMLSNDEANRIKRKVRLFKRRFDDDLARRNKILFGQ